MVDVQFVAAMGPPGGGRNPVTPRYLRHYHLLSIAEFDDDSMTQIFKQVTDWWTRRTFQDKEVRARPS